MRSSLYGWTPFSCRMMAVTSLAMVLSSSRLSGVLDWASPSSYVPEFTEALLKLKKGQTTDTPVKSQFGYHVIRVDDIRSAQLPAFEEVKPQIAQQMQQQKLAAFQEELRKKAKVE